MNIVIGFEQLCSIILYLCDFDYSIVVIKISILVCAIFRSKQQQKKRIVEIER